MQGTIVNAAAILAGSLLGVALKKGIKPQYQKSISQVLGLAVGVMGIDMALKSANMLLVIVSLVIGVILGEILNIEGKLEKLGAYLAKFFDKQGKETEQKESEQKESERKESEQKESEQKESPSLIGKGFVTASLIYCIGAMAVIGAIQDGLSGDTRVLYAKSLLDGIMSLVLASSMGIGVALSSVSVFVYQGTITMLAGTLAAFFSEKVVVELTATGGILIIGVSILILEITKIKLANWLPAIPTIIIIAYFFAQ